MDSDLHQAISGVSISRYCISNILFSKEIYEHYCPETEKKTKTYIYISILHIYIHFSTSNKTIKHSEFFYRLWFIRDDEKQTLLLKCIYNYYTECPSSVILYLSQNTLKDSGKCECVDWEVWAECKPLLNPRIFWLSCWYLGSIVTHTVVMEI